MSSEEGELVQLNGTEQQFQSAPNQTDVANLSDEQLVSAIQSTQTQLKQGTETESNNAIQNLVNETVQKTQDNNAQSNEQINIQDVQQQAQQAEQQGKKDNKNVTFNELAEKKHINSPDELATIYANLESELGRKSNRLAEAEKQIQQLQQTPQTQQVQQTQTPQYQDEYGNAISEQDYVKRVYETMREKDPLGTQKMVTEILLKQQLEPLQKTITEMKLRNEMIRLAGTPQTADFAEPEVQEEIQTLIKLKPDKYAGNLVDNLEDLYLMAKGRIATKKSQSSATVNNKQLPSQKVEGTSKQIPQKRLDINEMPIEELKSIVERAYRNRIE